MKFPLYEMERLPYVYPTFRCIKCIIFYCFCISCFKHWAFHDYSILYTEMWGKSGQIYPTFRCIKWIIFYCFCSSCFKHWTFHDYSILYTEMWGKSGQIYPTFRCIKWIIFYCFCSSCFKHWTFHDYSILYIEMWGKSEHTEMWGKSGQIYPTFRCIKWIIFYCFCISCFKHWTFHDYSILYTEMWGKSGHTEMCGKSGQIYPTFRCIKWIIFYCFCISCFKHWTF